MSERASEEAEAFRGEALRALVRGGAQAHLVAPLLAIVVLALALVRESMASGPMDSLAFLLRVIGYSLVARGALDLAALWRTFREALAAPRCTLRIDDDKLTLVRGDQRVEIAKRDAWVVTTEVREAQRVLVVLRPSAWSSRGFFVAIPAVFRATPGEIAERLMRWLADAPRLRTPLPPASTLPSKLYDEAAIGQPREGVVVVPQSYAFFLRGPFAIACLGVAMIDALVRADQNAIRFWDVPPFVPPLIAVALLCAPFVWMALAVRASKPGKGIALCVTEAELLFRVRGGVVRAPFATLERARIVTRASWSLLRGAHGAKQLVLERKNDEPIRCDADFVAAPLEALVALAEAQRARSRDSAVDDSADPPGFASNE